MYIIVLQSNHNFVAFKTVDLNINSTLNMTSTFYFGIEDGRTWIPDSRTDDKHSDPHNYVTFINAGDIKHSPFWWISEIS